MQLYVHIELDEPLVLPINYNHIIQAVIYRTLSVMPDYTDFCITEVIQVGTDNIRCFNLVSSRVSIELRRKV